MIFQKYISLLVFLFFTLSSITAHQKPYIINFARDKYQAASKNWAIDQDEKGIMYFGNDIGLLESDGMEWNLYSMPNHAFIKAVAVESHNNIYTGGLEEIGVWKRDTSGKLNYTSFKNLLPAKTLDNESIWRIWIDADKVYFQSFSNIYIYNQQTLQKLNNKNGFLLLAKVRNEFLIQEIYGPLLQLKSGKLEKIAGSEFLNGTITRVILPHTENKYLIGTSTGELYIYDRKNFIPWNNTLSKTLSGKELNCGIYCKKRNSYYLGTLLNGVYEVDMKGNILNHFYATNSIQNNTILALYEDLQNNIWVAMDHGIAYIRYTDGLSYYHTIDGNSHAIYDATLWNDYLLIGTNQGVYYTPKEKLNSFDMFSSLRLIKGTEGQVWSFHQRNNQLFCCHNNGILEICTDFKIRHPYRINCGVFRMIEHKLNGQPVNLLITYKEPHILNPISNEIKNITYPTDQISNAEFDHLGNIWLETVNRGVYKCRLANDMVAFRYATYYGQEQDSNLPEHLKVCKASGRIFFLGNDKFYTYDESKNALQPNPLLNKCFAEIQQIKRIIPINQDESWAITASSVYRFFYDGYIAYIKEAYKIEADNLSLITSSEQISILNDTLSLICLDAGFIVHNARSSKKHNYKLTAPSLKYIHTSGNKNQAYVNRNKPIQIPFENNTITVGFFVNNAFAGNLFVEYMLEGVDSTWSEPERKNNISYARLPHGEYQLHLRATDGLNNYSPESIVNFEILAPWYQTVEWYITCFSLILIGLYATYWIMKKQLQEQHLQKLKAQEHEHLQLMNEKLQNEIEEKNAELFTQTSFIIHKNELILKLKEIIDNISEINTQKSLIPLTRKINILLADNLNTEDDWKMFLIKFEQKHQFFFKTLKENYPTLTNNDLRLCACLKLNMETKDIASLMNLSIRAVENNRYRLRKKLNLKPTQNLNEFFLFID